MIRSPDHFYLNINNVWMTLMMVTPMALVMMVAMRSMFPSRNRNLLVVAGALVVFGVSYYGMRTQWAVGDEQFLKSMIPHHSGAILMCQEASITDPDIQRSEEHTSELQSLMRISYAVFCLKKKKKQIITKHKL